MSLKPLPPHMLWLDLETSGPDERTQSILEFGGVLVDTLTLAEIEARSWTVLYRHPDLEHANDIDPVVKRMHTESGLWAECASTMTAQFLGAVDWQVSDWLYRATRSRQHVVCCGSGVSHFDRRFIREQMPLTEKCLTYYAIDVGLLRRTFKAAGREDLIPPSGAEEAKPHRALEDARLHLDEFRYYAKVLGRVPNPISDARLRRGGW